MGKAATCDAFSQVLQQHLPQDQRFSCCHDVTPVLLPTVEPLLSLFKPALLPLSIHLALSIKPQSSQPQATFNQSTFFTKLQSNQTHQPKWIPSRTPPTTSLTRFRVCSSLSSRPFEQLTDICLSTGATAGASKEANKNVAKDSNAPLSSRASAGMDALGDKKDEKKHDMSAEGNKQKATH
jgi:hypothetical protein